MLLVREPVYIIAYTEICYGTFKTCWIEVFKTALLR